MEIKCINNIPEDFTSHFFQNKHEINYPQLKQVNVQFSGFDFLFSRWFNRSL